MTSSLILSRTLRADGDSTLWLERGSRAGRFVRVRPGAYVTADVWQRSNDRMRHALAVEALAATARRRVIFAVESAALLHGIPVVGAWPAIPRVLVADRPIRVRTATAPRWRPAEPHEIVPVARGWATSPARTAIDLAAERDLVSGVVALDDVLRRFDVDHLDLCGMLECDRPFRGARKVDAALAIANGVAESPLESLSLLRIIRMGFPRPQQQVEFHIAGETFYSDFFWPEHGLIGEADGLGKYLSPEDLIREKHREDALRSVVRGFTRWGWSDAWTSAPLEAKLLRAGLARATRFTSRQGGGT